MTDLKPWIIRHAKRSSSDWQSVIEGNDPVVVFLGGLLHLNETANGATLFNRLALLVGEENIENNDVRLAMVSETDPQPVFENLKSREAFNTKGEISAHAQQLTRELVLPASITGTLKGDALADAVARHLSRLSLVCFSAGTSLIRQIENLALDQLRASGLDAVQTARALNPLMGFGMGPVSLPDGSGEGFILFYSLLKGDVLAHRACDWAPYTAKIDDKNGIVLTRQGTHLFMADGAGDTQERGVKLIPSPIPGVPGSYQVILRQDGEGHSVFVYTNRREPVLNDTVLTYASSPSSEAVRDYVRHMVKGSVDAVKAGKIRDSRTLLDSFQASALSPAQLDRMIADYRAERLEFEKTIVTTTPNQSYDDVAQRIKDTGKKNTKPQAPKL